ncbi:hypothetical protein OH77DRAFT_1472817 [Trametes cingulata]|nr:hypothetical protein OH77DRAFT_1472817 [Trametes cingulata]
MRVSRSQRRLLLWLLQECGVKDVPSLKAYEELERQLRVQVGVPTTMHKSDFGNIFYSNSISSIICKDFSHPDLAKNIVIYPDESDRPISDFSQADYFKDLPRSELSPSYYRHEKHYFVNELSRLQTQEYFIPRVWITRFGEVYARGQYVSFDVEAGMLRVQSDETLVKAIELKDNFCDLATTQRLPVMIDDHGEIIDASCSPDREIAGGDDLVVICVPLFCDDVSGARSKQYQKHINIYTANWSLPSRFLQQESSVRFISTSPTATGCEQFVPVLDAVKASQMNPMRCYNAATHRFCRVRLRVPCLPADNPQQSEESSHAGVNANCKCRRCKKGGPPEVRESDDGYHELYTCGSAHRTVSDTRSEVQEQLRLACLGVEKPISNMQTRTGVKDKIACHWIEKLLARARQLKIAQPGISEADLVRDGLTWLGTQTSQPMNPLLNVPNLDPHRDTPVELLHTWLLGVVKYVWHMLHTSWTDAQRNTFVIRLQDTDISGLNIPPIRAAYMMQYRHGLIGKHFKSLAQTMAFKTYGLTTPAQAQLLRAMGELSAMLWVTQILDMDAHIQDVTLLIGNVLDAFANIDPARIIVKEKLQVLPHIVEDIRRFGPAPRYSTETYECFNAIFRLSSVHSNHQAPSRDIAAKMADIDCVRHIVTGGLWEDTDGCWTRAGPDVLSTFRDSPLLQHHFGWTLETPPPSAGSVQLPPRTRRVHLQTRQTCASSSEAVRPASFPFDSSWILGASVISRSGDVCTQHSWVIVTDNEGLMMTGQIAEILVPAMASALDAAHEGTSFVVVERFLLGSVRHPTTGCPVLRPPRPDTKVFEVICSTAVSLLLNVQHDCEAAKCAIAASSRTVRQERQDTGIREAGVAHNSDIRFYLINTHALHNAALLRQYLPRSLLVPLPLYDDRLKRHHELATGLRVTEARKRAETQKKRAETRQKKVQQGGTAVPGSSRLARSARAMDVSDSVPGPQEIQHPASLGSDGCDQNGFDGDGLSGRLQPVAGDRSAGEGTSGLSGIDSTCAPTTRCRDDDRGTEVARQKRRRLD